VIKASMTSGDWVAEHIRTYLENGKAAHLIDMSAVGGREGPTPSLLLRTVGRKSGRTQLVPLIYGRHGDEVILIASKGGAPQHPAWYLHMTSAAAVEYKLDDQCHRALWRELEGEEREQVWREMAELYPPYEDYQAATTRHIPVLALRPVAEIPSLSA